MMAIDTGSHRSLIPGVKGPRRGWVRTTGVDHVR